MGMLDIYGGRLHKGVMDAFLPAFDYLEKHLTGNYQEQYYCENSLKICRFLRLFDPSYAVENEAAFDAASVRELALVNLLDVE